MRPVMLDTNAYAAFKRNDACTIEVVQHAEWIVISPIMMGELLAGFDGGNKARQIKSNYINSWNLQESRFI